MEETDRVSRVQILVDFNLHPYLTIQAPELHSILHASEPELPLKAPIHARFYNHQPWSTLYSPSNMLDFTRRVHLRQTPLQPHLNLQANSIKVKFYTPSPHSQQRLPAPRLYTPFYHTRLYNPHSRSSLHSSQFLYSPLSTLDLTLLPTTFDYTTALITIDFKHSSVSLNFTIPSSYTRLDTPLDHTRLYNSLITVDFTLTPFMFDFTNPSIYTRLYTPPTTTTAQPSKKKTCRWQAVG